MCTGLDRKELLLSARFELDSNFVVKIFKVFFICVLNASDSTISGVQHVKVKQQLGGTEHARSLVRPLVNTRLTSMIVVYFC